MSKKYDFETILSRKGQGSYKWEQMYEVLPELEDDIVPFSVADMELKIAPEIREGLKKYIDEAILGYTGATDKYYEAVISWMKRRHNFKVEKDSVTVNIANGYTRNSKTSTKTAENIVSKSEKNTVIVSDDYIGLESIGEMSIYGSDINLIGKEKDIRIETPSEIRIKGRKVHNN